MRLARLIFVSYLVMIVLVLAAAFAIGVLAR